MSEPPTIVIEVTRDGVATGVLVNGTRLDPAVVRSITTTYGPETGFVATTTVELRLVRPTIVVVPDQPCEHPPDRVQHYADSLRSERCTVCGASRNAVLPEWS